MRYPNYMNRQRRAGITASELTNSDHIRQSLMAVAQRRGFVITYYTDQRGRHMARIGRADGVGMGFVVSAKQLGF